MTLPSRRGPPFVNYELTQLGQLQRSSRVEEGAGPWGRPLPEGQPSSVELAAVADAPDTSDTVEAAEAAAEAAAAAAVAAMGLELRGAVDGMLVPMMAHRARRRRRRQPSHEAQPLWAKAEVETDAEAEARAEAEAAVEASRYGFRLRIDSGQQATPRVAAKGAQLVAEAGSVAVVETVTEVGAGAEAGEEARAAEAPKSVEVQERRLSSWHVASHIVFAEALASLTAEDCVQARPALARPATPRAPARACRAPRPRMTRVCTFGGHAPTPPSHLRSWCATRPSLPSLRRRCLRCRNRSRRSSRRRRA